MFDKFFSSKKYTSLDLLDELLNKQFDKLKLEKVYNSGLKLTWQNEKSETYLHLCAKENKPSSVQWLIKHGLDVDIKTIQGKTPLFYAAKNGSFESAELLINKSADIHILDNDKRTVLQEAVNNNQIEIVKLLLKYPNDINNIDDKDKTVLFDSIVTLNKDIIQLILNVPKLNLNYIDMNGNSILFHDNINVDSSIPSLFIERGIKLELTNNDGLDYVFYSMLNRLLSLEILKKVLSLGYDLNTKCNGKSLIITLMEMKNPDAELIKFLLSRHINLEEVDDNGETVIFKTVRNNDLVNTKLFLNKEGININHKNNEGNTVLVYAALQGKVFLEIILMLLKYGANPNIADIKGSTLIEKIIETILHIKNKKKISVKLLKMINKDEDYMYIFEKILENSKVFLRKLNSNGKPLFFETIFCNNKELFKLLKFHGADINHKDKNSQNILHNLLTMSDFPIFKDQKGFQKLLHELIFYGADVNSKDDEGSTTVHNAILLTNEQTVKVLLDSKANLKATNKKGRTLVHNCVWDGKLKHFKLVHNYNENILNMPDGYGILPINYAAFIGHTELVLEMITARAHVNNPHKKNEEMVRFFGKYYQNVYNLNDSVRDEFEKKNIKILITNMKKEFALQE